MQQKGVDVVVNRVEHEQHLDRRLHPRLLRLNTVIRLDVEGSTLRAARIISRSKQNGKDNDRKKDVVRLLSLLDHPPPLYLSYHISFLSFF
jgi:hypothetical protein